MKLQVVIIALALCVAVAVAECPNACSGHGTCGNKDQCSCYKSYMGNDCSLRMCPFGHAHVDIPKGDLDGDGAITGPSTTKVAGHNVYHAGIGEQYGYTTARADDGHFYAECSNKGICDRDSGSCSCLEGYEGSSCQRASCPNSCSGHGTCESMHDLANIGVFHSQSEATNAYGLDTFNVHNRIRGDRTTAFGSTTYTLWDAHATFGCLCDPGFYGADCSLRLCSYGVDPLYTSDATPVYENYNIFATDSGTLGGTIKIRFYDVFGQDYTTDAITVAAAGAGASTDCDNYKNALLALPNSVIPDLLCESSKYALLKGIRISLYFNNNPGELKPIQIADNSLTGSAPTIKVTAGMRRGEFVDKTTLSAFTVQSYFGSGGAANAPLGNAGTVDGTKQIQLNEDTSTTAAFAAGSIIKVADQHMVVTSCTQANPGVCTLAYHYFASDVLAGTEIWLSSDVVSDTIGSADNQLTAAITGSHTFSSFYTTTQLAVGNLVVVEGQRIRVTSVTDYNTVSKYFVWTGDRPFGGVNADNDGASNAYDLLDAGFAHTDEADINDHTCTTKETLTFDLTGCVVGDNVRFGMDGQQWDTVFVLGDGSDIASLDARFTGYLPEADDGFGVSSAFATATVTTTFNNCMKPTPGKYTVYGGAATSCTNALNIGLAAADGGVIDVTNSLDIHKVTEGAAAFSYVEQCSGRGLCDSSTGSCECFTGYYGASCGTQNVYAL